MGASWRSPTERETDQIAEVVREIRGRVPIQSCACLGLLNEAKAKTLQQAGVERVNHNLNTSRRHHPNVCTTHTYDDRVETVKIVREAGMSTCCGGIMG